MINEKLAKQAKSMNSFNDYIEGSATKRYGGFYYKVLERDNYRCKNCNSQKNIMIHYIIPYDVNNDNTIKFNNLVTLCSRCHTTLHNRSNNKKIGLLPNKSILDEIEFSEEMLREYETLIVTLHETLQCNGIEKEIEIEIDKDINTMSLPSEATFDDFQEKTSEKRKPTKDLDSFAEDTFNFWNEQKIIVHSPDTFEIIKDSIIKAEKNYGHEKILKGIKNYATMYHDKDYFLCTYKWSLSTFLKQKNCLPDFLDGGSKWESYKIRGENGSVEKGKRKKVLENPQYETVQSVLSEEKLKEAKEIKKRLFGG